MACSRRTRACSRRTRACSHIVNEGPSLLKAFGPFVGGQFEYWPNDNGKLALSQLEYFNLPVIGRGQRARWQPATWNHAVDFTYSERCFFSVETRDDAGRTQTPARFATNWSCLGGAAETMRISVSFETRILRVAFSKLVVFGSSGRFSG